MLAHLQHVAYLQGAHETLARPDETAVAQHQIAVHQFIERRLLVRILAVAQPPLLEPAFCVSDGPTALSVDQGRFAQGNGHFLWKGIAQKGGIHFFQIAHGVFLRKKGRFSAKDWWFRPQGCGHTRG